MVAEDQVRAVPDGLQHVPHDGADGLEQLCFEQRALAEAVPRTRGQRAAQALENVGVPLFDGGLLSLLAEQPQRALSGG